MEKRIFKNLEHLSFKKQGITKQCKYVYTYGEYSKYIFHNYNMCELIENVKEKCKHINKHRNKRKNLKTVIY